MLRCKGVEMEEPERSLFRILNDEGLASPEDLERIARFANLLLRENDLTGSFQAAGPGLLVLGLAEGERTFFHNGIVFAALDAFKGEDKFKGAKVAVRTLMVLYPNRMHVVSIEGTGINKLADLKGKRVPAGYSAMRTLDRNTLAMLATAGLTLSDVRPVMVPNVIRGADDFHRLPFASKRTRHLPHARIAPGIGHGEGDEARLGRRRMIWRGVTRCVMGVGCVCLVGRNRGIVEGRWGLRFSRLRISLK